MFKKLPTCLLFIFCFQWCAAAFGAPLVTNGGFELGDYTGWTVVQEEPMTAIIVNSTNEGEDVHSGNFAALYASVGSPPNSISQVLTTTPGTVYTISFWEQVGIGGFGNFNPGTQEFKALFGDITLMDQTATTGTVYTNYTFQATATSASTTLEFDSRNDPNWNELDDVVVTVSESSDLGDFNRDGKINNSDLSTMMNALADRTGYKSAYHLSDEDLLAIGDLNGDGEISNADLQSLICKIANNAVSGTTVVPEPSTLALLTISALGLLVARRRG